jgi:hypothetical protein
LIDDICAFAGLPQAKPRPVAAAASAPPQAVPQVAAAASARPVPKSNKKQGKKGDAGKVPELERVDLTDFSLYRPGEKIVIPLTTPDEHLTGPCWRGMYQLIKICFVT